MKQRPSLLLRLMAPPAIAAMAVVILAGLSLFDLARGRRHAEEEAHRERREAIQPPPTKDLAPITANVPQLSEDQALKSLRERPSRAAILTLWPLGHHREGLFELLISERTPEEVRLHLLGLFDEAAPKKAREAARSIVAEKDLHEGPLIFSALEVLSRNGGREDLPLFAERQGESHQLKTLREEYRDQLQSQTR